MTAAVLALLAALVPVVVLLIRRHLAKADDKFEVLIKRKADVDRAIASGDSDSINLQLDDALRRLQDRGRNPSGQSGDPPPSGSELSGNE